MPEEPVEKEPLFDHILLPGKSTGHSTGPRTPEGKERSSQNARTHGCTSRKLILPGEREEDYRALLGDWLEDFQPQAATAMELVVQTAQAHWFYLRVLRQCDAAEAGMSGQNPLEWSEDEWKRRERMGRYRTTAERSFHRALTALEARRKSRMAEQWQAERIGQAAQRIELAHLARLSKETAQAEAAKQKAASAAAAPPKKKKQGFGVAEQWVEVRVTEGVTSTVYVPSNDTLRDEIEEAIEKGEGEPRMVYRRLNFPDGVPIEYAWTNLHEPERCEETQAGRWCRLCSVKARGGHGMQRMTYETWEEAIEREALMPGGHAGPSGRGNLPRPKERGGEVGFEEMVGWEDPQQE